MEYTTREALRGDGGPRLQARVRAHVEARERNGGYETSSVVRGVQIRGEFSPDRSGEPTAHEQRENERWIVGFRQHERQEREVERCRLKLEFLRRIG